MQDRSGYIEYSEFENLLNQLVKVSSRILANLRQGSFVQVPASCEFPPGRVKQLMPELRGQSYYHNLVTSGLELLPLLQLSDSGSGSGREEE